ncbi:MAG: hypothetical protein ABJA66_05300 [Actinomycetota bacterium]
MPFGNFYDKSDKETSRHWKSVVLTFSLLAIVFISVYGLYMIREDYITEYVKESARIKHVDALCTNLPKPLLFNFVNGEKPVSDNNNATEIIYHYQTERDLKVIMPQFLAWFSSNGWKRNPNNELIFTKGNQTISIESGDNYFTHYDISCSEEEISFGIYDY